MAVFTLGLLTVAAIVLFLAPGLASLRRTPQRQELLGPDDPDRRR